MKNRRPTISDLAREADVSVSTVNRILSGETGVRATTIEIVQIAAERIGYYGVKVISARRESSRPFYRLGFLLQQSTRDLYLMIGDEIENAAKRITESRIKTTVEFVDILEPSNIAIQLLELGKRCDAVAIIAADHPLIGQAIRELKDQGVPVTSYITDQSTPDRAAFVGGDDWKIGRTAAWLLMQMTQGLGSVAVFIGHHRYQTQDISDASFRSFLREHAPRLFIEDSYPTHEESSRAYNKTKDLVASKKDLVGILVLGGGISGALQALREIPFERRKSIRLICREIGPEARKGLSEGIVTAALRHPLDRKSDLLIRTMIDTISKEADQSTIQRTIPFEIITPENV